MALLLLLAGLGLGTLGCELPATMAYMVTGPPSVPAEYKPEQTPMLVMVESFGNPSASQVDADQLAHQLREHLRDKNVAPLVDSPLHQDLHASSARSAPMSISELGRRAGAEQVLYVDLRQAEVYEEAGSGLVRGRMFARVRIVDAQTGQTRWPEQFAAGYPIQLETPYFRLGGDVTPDMVRRRMHANMAQRIARLFYRWKPDNLSER